MIKGEYQNNKIFIDTSNTKDVYKTVLGDYIISSSEDIVLENIIRDHDLTNPKIDSDFLKIIKGADTNDPFNVFINSKNLNLLKVESFTYFITFLSNKTRQSVRLNFKKKT